jgi:hypothetical protein|tara:strand:- start:450 stop:1112 length:663 start_codon:yes stop_codon:yes gene_type:complete
MQVYTGDTRKLDFIKIIQDQGWGRLWSSRVPTQYQQDLTPNWVMDNNVYSETTNKKKHPNGWSGIRWDERLHQIIERDLEPDFIVLPDTMGNGPDTIISADYYIEQYAVHGFYNEIQTKYAFALQEGMTPDTVARWLDVWDEYDHVLWIGVLFLGGGDDFKKLAPAWARLAHSRGMQLHYARAGTPAKVKHARDSGADSIDSAFPLWEQSRFEEFVKAAS